MAEGRPNLSFIRLILNQSNTQQNISRVSEFLGLPTNEVGPVMNLLTYAGLGVDYSSTIQFLFTIINDLQNEIRAATPLDEGEGTTEDEVKEAQDNAKKK